MTNQTTDASREALIAAAKVLRQHGAGFCADADWIWRVTTPYIREKWIVRFSEALKAYNSALATKQPMPLGEDTAVLILENACREYAKRPDFSYTDIIRAAYRDLLAATSIKE